MSLDVPAEIEHGVRVFADERGMTMHEAVLHLIQAGLSAQQPETRTFDQGLGMFGNSEDAHLLDEVVMDAYAERRRPTKRVTPA